MCIFALVKGLNGWLDVFSKVVDTYRIKQDTYREKYRINNEQEFCIIKHDGKGKNINHDRHVKNQQDVHIS